jgi:O-antigen/teichoic acid export membrane protein
MKSIFDNNSFLPENYALIVKNTGLLAGLQGLQRIFGLAATYFVVRALSPTAFGEYHFVLSIIGVVAVFGLPGMSNAVMQAVARGHVGTFRLSVRPTFLASLIGVVTLLVFGGYYRATGGNDLSLAFFAAAALYPFAYGLKQWAGLRTGKEDFAGIVKLNGTASVVTSLLLIGAVLYVTDSFAVLVGIIVLVQAVLNVSVTVSTLRKMGEGGSVESGSISYGVKTTAYSIFATLAQYVDKLLIYAFITPAALAVFVAAERIPEQVKALIKNLATVLAPRFARHRGYTKRVDRAFKLFSIVTGVGIVLIAFTILPWAVVALFGDGYKESVPYAQALMCSIALVSSVPLRSRFIVSQQDSASFRDINLAMSISRIVTSAIFIPLLGIVGAVISAFVSRIGFAVAIYIVMKKRYPITD